MAPDLHTSTIEVAPYDPAPAQEPVEQPTTPLPVMEDLDRLQGELDQIDATLRALDS